jgi:hypothetical protein
LLKLKSLSIPFVGDNLKVSIKEYEKIITTFFNFNKKLSKSKKFPTFVD